MIHHCKIGAIFAKYGFDLLSFYLIQIHAKKLAARFSFGGLRQEWKFGLFLTLKGHHRREFS